MRIDSPIVTGSFSVNGDSLLDLNTLTTTGSNTFIGNQSIVGAVSASSLTGSLDYSNIINTPTLVSGSSQVIDIISTLNSYTASNNTTNQNQNNRLDIIESVTGSYETNGRGLVSGSSQVTPLLPTGTVSGSSQVISILDSLNSKTGSFATTGSNTFFGTQVFTGSVYISENLIVQGSSSLENITASAVNIGTNKIILNVDNPTFRYAGISVYDSGSTAGTGSLFWDSINNYWIYEHPADSEAPYNSAILISGPKNTGSLGEETGLINNYIVKSVGGDHISSSAIYDDGSAVSIKSTTQITGSLTVSQTGSFGVLKTNDLLMNNEHSEPNAIDGTHGSWLIQEGENDLFIINQLSGKKYKFNLTEIK